MDKPTIKLANKIHHSAAKSIADAPNLRDRFNAACILCKHFQPIEGALTNEGVCTLYDFATNMDYVCDSFEPIPAPDVAEQVAEAIVEAMPAMSDSSMMSIAYGSEIKSLANGHIGGYLVRFGSPKDTDADGEYFDATTDYGFTKGEEISSPVWLNHCQPMRTGNGKAVAVREPIGQSTIKMVDDGIVIDAILYERAQYEKMIESLGWSSGTADHTIKRKQNGKSIHIARWHLGLDASLTPKPADPRNAVVSIKSLSGKTQNLQAEPEATIPIVAAQATVTASNAKTTILTSAGDASQSQEKVMDEKELTAALAPIVDKLTALETATAANTKALRNEPAPNKGTNIQVEPDEKLPYKSIKKVGSMWDYRGLGEQLGDIARAAKGEGTSPRLIAAMDIQKNMKGFKAALGSNEQVGSQGGFLVQHDNAGWLQERAFAESMLADKCQNNPVGAGFNGITLRDWDETSRVDGSQYGGMAAYWIAEAGAYTASQPKFREVELQLNKLIALYYATDEELEDAVGLSGRISAAFPRVMRWKIDNAILRGTGAGQPLGILNSGYKVSVTRTTTSRVLFEDIVNMYARMMPYLDAGAEWYINRDVLPQLLTMNLAVGTGGVPVYLPANGAAGAPFGTLFGKSINSIEQCSSMGTVGDIIYANFQDYLLARKGDVQEASSIHVAFTTGEQTFRFTTRVTGRPAYSTVLTPSNGTNTLAANVVLAT